jgi:hypothetical protein
MGTHAHYTHFDETDDIRRRRRAWIISKESDGPLAPITLALLTDLLKGWLEHHGLPSDEASARKWVEHYAQQVMSQQLHATAVAGATDPDIMGTLGIDEADQLMAENTSVCTRCNGAVFWAYVVKRDGTTGRPAPFDVGPASAGEHHMTVRGDANLGPILAAHRYGTSDTHPRYQIHFDTCMNPQGA